MKQKIILFRHFHHWAIDKSQSLCTFLLKPLYSQITYGTHATRVRSYYLITLYTTNFVWRKIWFPFFQTKNSYHYLHFNSKHTNSTKQNLQKLFYVRLNIWTIFYVLGRKYQQHSDSLWRENFNIPILFPSILFCLLEYHKQQNSLANLFLFSSPYMKHYCVLLYYYWFIDSNWRETIKYSP